MKNHKHLYEPDSALMYSVMITELYQFRVGLGTRIRLPFRWVSCRRCRKFPICVQHQSAWFCRGGSRNANKNKFKVYDSESDFGLPTFESDLYKRWRTLRSLVASSLTRVLFPTISAGKHKSSKIALWTEVKVLLNGLFCFWFLVLRVGFGKILL